jgi:hypothetical protein
LSSRAGGPGLDFTPPRSFIRLDNPLKETIVKLSVYAAALAVVAVPLFIQDAEGQTPPKEKRYCDVQQPTGSRLGAVRRCRTKSVRDAAKAEGRATVERIQAGKNLTEAMSGMGARAMCSGSPRGC